MQRFVEFISSNNLDKSVDDLYKLKKLQTISGNPQFMEKKSRTIAQNIHQMRRERNIKTKLSK